MVHIITASRNRRDETVAFVRSLKQQSYEKIHLILVDDGSTDGTREAVKEILPKSTIIVGNGNLWWGGALHKAYQWVNKRLSNRPDDIVFITNDDVTYHKDYIGIGVECVSQNPYDIIHGEGYDAVSGELADTIYHVDYNRSWNDTIFYESGDGIGECSSTRSLFMRVEIFLKMGDFHPFLLPHYGSDTEWTMRAQRKGIKIKTDRRLRYDLERESISGRPPDELTLKKIFSKKSNANPFYRMNSLILSTPIKYMPRECARQIIRYFSKAYVIKDIIIKGIKS